MRLQVKPGPNDKRVVSWSIDGLKIGSLAITPSDLIAHGKSIALGYMDKYASISATPEQSFALIDNLVVDGKSDHADDFEVDHSGTYRLVKSSNDAYIDWSYDYVATGIPPAPNSRAGHRRGVRLAVNQVAPEGPEAITLHLEDALESTGVVECDVWVNYPRPLKNPIHGGTEFVTLGVLSSPDRCNGGHNDWGSGIWVAMNGDGEVDRDFQFFVGPNERVNFYSVFGESGANGEADYFAGQGSRAQEMLYLAMCYHGLGNQEKADALLQSACAYLELARRNELGLAYFSIGCSGC